MLCTHTKRDNKNGASAAAWPGLACGSYSLFPPTAHLSSLGESSHNSRRKNFLERKKSKSTSTLVFVRRSFSDRTECARRCSAAQFCYQFSPPVVSCEQWWPCPAVSSCSAQNRSTFCTRSPVFRFPCSIFLSLSFSFSFVNRHKNTDRVPDIHPTAIP